MSNTITFSLRCGLSLLLLNLAATLLGAQEVTQVPAPAVTATAAGVRIAAPGEGQQLRLEVFATSGERRFDSGLTAGQPLDWSLQDQAGQRLADGTYRLAVTTTEVSGQTTQHQRRLTLKGGEVSLAEESPISPLANQVVDGDIVFTSPGQSTYARDIRLSDNFGGLRFYGADSLTTTPAGAAIQFFGNNATNFPGQLYLDSGALDAAALIFRTAPTGGTITERMRVTSGGNVGIGTSSPTRKLHVVSQSTAVYGDSSSGDGVEGRSSSGTGVRGQSGSFTGVFGNSGSGKGVYGFSFSGIGVEGLSNPGGIAIRADGSSWFKGDTTPLNPSLTGSGTGIVIGSGGNLGYISAFDYGVFQPRILALNNSGGGVGIGTTTPDQTLTVNGNASKPGGGSWATFSDERLKTMRGRFTPGLSAVMQLQPLRYQYKTDNALGLKMEGEHIGFGAQAVAQIIPEAVTRNDKGYLLVNNDPILWAMLNAIKEQQTQIEQQQKQIESLKQIVCLAHPDAEVCKAGGK